MKKDFHCCATCIHFSAAKTKDGMVYECVRLGFETKTHYKFDCWTPRENILQLIDKQK